MLATARLQRILLLVLTALLAGIAVILLSQRVQQSGISSAPARATSRFDGPTLPPGLHAAGFSLRDENGKRVSLSALRGHVVLLTFIHSRCHDTCPFMVQQIKGALNLLPGAGHGIPTVGITVAPAEDTRASRRAFLRQQGMANRLAFLNGPPAAIRRVWRGYGIQPVAGPIDHSTFVLLIDRRGIERVGFPADELTPEGLAHDLRVLAAEPA